MLRNTVLAFMIPWLVGFYLYRRDRFTVVTITPFAVATAMLFNAIGVQFGFWTVAPVLKLKSLSALPMDLGIYPVLASWFAMAVKERQHTWGWMLAFTLITTILEWVSLALGVVSYGDGWNLAWTAVSYLAAYLLVYVYQCMVQNASSAECAWGGQKK